MSRIGWGIVWCGLFAALATAIAAHEHGHTEIARRVAVLTYTPVIVILIIAAH